MIAYEVLCQAIADWKAGARPSSSSAHMSTAAAYDGEPQPVEEIESGLVEMDGVDVEHEHAEQASGEYAEQASGEYAEQASGEYAEQASGEYVEQASGEYAEQASGEYAQQSGEYAEQAQQYAEQAPEDHGDPEDDEHR